MIHSAGESDENFNENPAGELSTVEIPCSSANILQFLYCLFMLFGRPGGSIGRVGGLCSSGNFLCREQVRDS